MSDCCDKLMILFLGKEINIFILFYNEFKNDILEVMREELYLILLLKFINYSILNGSCYNEGGNFDEDDIVDFLVGVFIGGFGFILVLQSV